MSDATKPSRPDAKLPNHLIIAAWCSLCAVIAALLALAVYLLFKTGLFSGNSLNDEQFKSLWAFLGVSLGAAATIVGALIAEQNNRRSNALAWEAEKREIRALRQQKAQTDEAEIRLTLETRTKALELITYENDYAPKARVGAAVATMMELGGGPVPLNLLADLWGPGKIGTGTAVWLIDRVLTDEKATAAQKIQASMILNDNASKLIPSKADINQDWNQWPDALTDRWPIELPGNARSGVVALSVKVLLSREFDFWLDSSFFPIDTLKLALDDDENSSIVAFTLLKLTEFLDIPQIDVGHLQILALTSTPAQWYRRLLDQIGPWARGEVSTPVRDPSSARSSFLSPLQESGAPAAGQDRQVS